MRLALALLVLALLALTAPARCQAQDNIALGAPATFSRPAQYRLTTDANDSSQLTDGRTVFGTMWRSREAVGWGGSPTPIAIELDLGIARPIGVVCIRAARGLEQGVAFPRRIDLFSSTDKDGYVWSGFIAPRDEAGDGGALSRTFCFPPARRTARYVRLLVAPHGHFFFSDEITISAADGDRPPTALVRGGDLARFAAAQQGAARMIGTLQARMAASPATQYHAPRLRDIADILSGRLHDIGLSDLDRLREDMFRVVAASRRDQRLGFGAVRTDPWRLATPVSDAAAVAAETPLLLPQGGHGVLAVALSHADDAPVVVEVKTRVLGAPDGAFAITALRAGFVLRGDGTMLADPLWPLEKDRITVPPGQTVQLWVDVAAAAQAGPTATLETTLTARMASGPVAHTMRTPVHVYARPQASDAPAAVAWGYFDSPLLENRARAATRDMLAHGIDTAVIPAWHHLPFPRPASTPHARPIGDYARYDAILQALCCHQRYLFFLAFNGDSALRRFRDSHTFLSPAWKTLFVAWIREWTGRLRAAGLDESRFAFYPVDEPHPGAEHDALVAVGRLVKEADPSLAVYTTVHRPEVITEDVLSVVDIFQLNGPADTPETIARLKARGKTVWSYATDGGGKAGDPAAFYRAQAWKAFISGLSGIGFWSYSDIGRSGSVWNDWDDVQPDFAVVYESPGGLISSKRWEAWRQGVQDFALLSAAARTSVSQSDKAKVVDLARAGRGHVGDEARLTAIRRRLADMIMASGRAGDVIEGGNRGHR
ncbi:MAG: hypothetical protein R3D68_00260 [Hyphomicrobiaceae bacterium]